MSLARRRGSVRALYQTDAGPFACIRPEDSTSCFDVPENALALAAFIWCPVIARIMGVDRRPIARNDDVGSTQMQFALAAKFYGTCVRRDARGGDCLPRPLRMARCQKIPSRAGLSERAAPRPADDAVAMLHASSGRHECDPGQPSVSEPQRRTGRAVLLVGWRLSAICSSVRRPYALRAPGMPPASKMSSRDVPWRSPLVIARRTSRHWQGLEDTERSPSREASS
jgi:hypothetical protein